MRCLLFTIYFFSNLIFANAQGIERLELRNSFQQCLNMEKTESFLEKMNLQQNASAILTGYKGAATGLQAKYSSNPYKKYNFCKKGLSLIDNAIESDPLDLELRYLRLILETNIPGFLGMNHHVQGDKNVIMKGISAEKDISLKKLISQFLLKSDICTESEKKHLSEIS